MKLTSPNSNKESRWYSPKSGAKTGDIIKIVDEAKWIDKEWEGETYKKLSCNIEVNGVEKIFEMNASCSRVLKEAFGDDTAEWVGHKAKVFIAPTPKGDKKMILLEALVDVDEF